MIGGETRRLHSNRRQTRIAVGNAQRLALRFTFALRIASLAFSHLLSWVVETFDCYWQYPAQWLTELGNKRGNPIRFFSLHPLHRPHVWKGTRSRRLRKGQISARQCVGVLYRRTISIYYFAFPMPAGPLTDWPLWAKFIMVQTRSPLQLEHVRNFGKARCMYVRTWEASTKGDWCCEVHACYRAFVDGLRLLVLRTTCSVPQQQALGDCLSLD